jgi:hypothetical protein
MDTDEDPDPEIFASDLQDVNKKLFCIAGTFFKAHLYHFSKIKNHKEVTKQ